jgi:hypothetical protein
VPLFRVINTMQMTSGLPDDASVNVFHLTGLAPFAAETELGVNWATFQNVIQSFYGDQVAQTGHSLRVYAMADPEPRRPVATITWGFSSAPTGETMPHEVALCLSYQGEPISGEEQASRRGRMYIGPLKVSEIGDGRPFTTTLEDITDGFAAFVDAMGTEGYQFVVYSRLHGTSTLPTSAWMDNAFDTQRRRGVAATSRVTVSLA